MKNVFILGLDQFNLEELQSIRQAETCNFIGLLGHQEVVKPPSGAIEFEHLRQAAGSQLRRFQGSIDGIAAFWDFPSSALVGVLRNERQLPGPTNEAIAKCEHKYWSRLEQREAVPDLVPDFCAVDPFARAPSQQIHLEYPFWLKPVKAHSSHLGFRIGNTAELDRHIPEIREKIGYFGRPFDEYLRHVHVPAAVNRVGGSWCIAEAIISAGRQCTLEGYVSDGQVTIYGVVDSIRSGKHRSCFSRYQYPSHLPRRVQRRMIDAAKRIMNRFGYDNSPFNMEFYWDQRRDRIRILEINARISKSHCPLFRMVDGASHQEVMVDLALGQRPDFPHRQGDFRIAGKFMYRVFEDGLVRRMPSTGEMARVMEVYPEARFHLLAKGGDRLRHMPHQDSYSYELAEIFLGARDQRELLQKYANCLEMLTIEVTHDYQDAA